MSDLLFPVAVVLILLLAVGVAFLLLRGRRKLRLTGRPVLNPVQTSFFHTLRQALPDPDHTVLAGMPLSQFIEPQGLSAKRSEQLLRQLDQQTTDFLICDAQLRPVVCVSLDSEPDKATRESLTAARIPFLGWRSTALPTHQEIASAIKNLRSPVTAGRTERDPAINRVEPGLGEADLPDLDSGRQEPRL